MTFAAHLLTILLGSCILLSPLCSVAQEKSPEPPKGAITVKGTPRQGNLLFVTVTGTSKDDMGDCTWRGKRYPLVAEKAGLGVMLPVALNTPKGSYRLRVEVKKAEVGEPVVIERLIATTPHTYGVQRIWLSASQLSKYDNPQADRDNDDIKNALSFNTDTIHWNRSFIWPVNTYISTKFGLKRFYNDDKEPEFHRGIDLPAATGTPVKASQRGVVRFAKKNLLLHGTTAVIDHGKGIGTLYLHMNSLKVKEGDPVEQGDVIGTVGSTGAGTGPHLHWAAYCQGEAIDPQLLFHIPPEWLGR